MKLPVSIPNLEKQKEIVALLNTAQQEIKLFKKLANQYRTQKRGLMQKLLSGKWHIKNKEAALSQNPALQELIALGYEYLSPEQALAMRGGKNSNVLLESVLREQLKKFNRIQYKGRKYHFSEANIQEAIQKIKNVKYDGLQKTNEAIYDLITLGTALGQTVEGSNKSFNLNYIDWKHLPTMCSMSCLNSRWSVTAALKPSDQILCCL